MSIVALFAAAVGREGGPVGCQASIAGVSAAPMPRGRPAGLVARPGPRPAVLLTLRLESRISVERSARAREVGIAPPAALTGLLALAAAERCAAFGCMTTGAALVDGSR